MTLYSLRFLPVSVARSRGGCGFDLEAYYSKPISRFSNVTHSRVASLSQLELVNTVNDVGNILF